MSHMSLAEGDDWAGAWLKIHSLFWIVMPMSACATIRRAPRPYCRDVTARPGEQAARSVANVKESARLSHPHNPARVERLTSAVAPLPPAVRP